MKLRSSSTRAIRGEGVASLDLRPAVLLAEDDRPFLEVLRRLLEADHFRVLTAANGQDTLAVAERSMPDLVVTDVAMPRLDGFGLLRGLRRLYPDIPVIVISGDDWYADRPVATAAAELGALATLMKPVDLALLHRAIRRALPWNGEDRPRERLSA